jgi:hypothetical protein
MEDNKLEQSIKIMRQLWYIEWASIDSKNYWDILMAIEIIEKELKSIN